ncbi:MAG: TonB-dependent receptor [Gemmatimonadota bacterium]
MPCRLVRVVLVGAVLIAMPALVGAQTGRVEGVVRAGAVAISGAEVTILHAATGASRRATTTEDGRYVLDAVPVGTYTVEATAFGFTPSVQVGVQVSANETARADFTFEPIGIEGVTVTAMLREQDAGAVPLSIAAPTADELRARGADDIEDIAAGIAGFSVQNLGPGQSQVAMRGASSGQIARDQPGVKEQVGVYLDDVPVSLSLFTPDFDLFDVSRVEVLRGPQGTLFGAGSLAGTVRYITRQPELGTTAVFGEAGGNWIDGGTLGGSAKIGVNVPLGGTAAARVAAYHTRLGGYTDEVQPDLRIREDANGGRRGGVRAALRLEPSARLSITPRILFQYVRMDGWNRIDTLNILANPYTTTRPAVTLGERRLFAQLDEPYSDDFLLTDMNLQYDLGPMELTSIMSYANRDIRVVRDGTALTASFTGGTMGLPESIYTLDSPVDDVTASTVWTQELRLAGRQNAVTWLLGGFYSRSERDYGQSVMAIGFDEAAAPYFGAPVGWTEGIRAERSELFYSDITYDLQQYALFGEGTVALTNRLDLTLGLRYYDVEEDRVQIFDGVFGNPENGSALLEQAGATDADGLAPRFIASVRASDAVTINAQASRGFRLGGINDPLNVPLCTEADLERFSGRESWRDETAWNYEVGVKSRLAGGRVTLNASAFYMDISDLQLTVTAGTCSSRLIVNVDEARSRGLELEVAAAPSANLDLSASASFNDSELLSTFTDGAGQVLSGIRAGNRLPSVPKLKLAGVATYRREVGPGSQAFMTGSYHHVGSRYTEIGDLAEGFGTVDLEAFGPNTIGGPLSQSTFTFDPLLPAYDVLNARVGLVRGDWELALHVDNLTDERAFLALDRERGGLARVGYLTNQPRTVGVSMRFGY